MATVSKNVLGATRYTDVDGPYGKGLDILVTFGNMNGKIRLSSNWEK
jgi:hypothetical protein